MPLLAACSLLLALAPHSAVAERIRMGAAGMGEPSFHASARELLSPRRQREEEGGGPGAEQGDPLAEGGGAAASQVQVAAGKFDFGKFGGKFGKFGGKFGKFGGGKFGKFGMLGGKFGKFGGKFGKHRVGKFGKNKRGMFGGKWGKAGKNKHGAFGGSMWGKDKGAKNKHGKNTHYQGGGYMPPNGGNYPHAGGNNPYVPSSGNYPGGHNGGYPGHAGYSGYPAQGGYDGGYLGQGGNNGGYPGHAGYNRYPAQGGYDGGYLGQGGNTGGYHGGRGGHNGVHSGQGVQHGGYPGQGGYGGYGVGNPMPLFLGARGPSGCQGGEPLADESTCRTEAARQFGTALRSTTSSGQAPGGCSFDRRSSTLAFNTNLRAAAGNPAMIPVCLLRPPPGGGRSPVGRVFLGGLNTKDCAGGFPITNEGECKTDAAMKLGVNPAGIQSVALAGVPGGCVFNGEKAVVIFNTVVSSTATNGRIMPVCKVAA